MPFADYYSLLNVKVGASHAEVKKAYHRAALDSHPDKVSRGCHDGTNEEKHLLLLEAEKSMKLLNEAIEVLGDPARRKRYDREWGFRFELANRKPEERSESKTASTMKKKKTEETAKEPSTDCQRRWEQDDAVAWAFYNMPGSCGRCGHNIVCGDMPDVNVCIFCGNIFARVQGDFFRGST